MNKDQFLFLAAKIFSSEASPEEIARVEAAMQQDPSLKIAYHQYKKHWNTTNSGQQLSVEHALQATWDKINAARAEDGQVIELLPPARRFAWSRIAAAVLFIGVLTLTWIFIGKKSEDSVEYMEAYNTMGVRSNLVLPDGTQVWLAADSRLKYPSAFKGDRREIILNGEDFFDVKRDTLHPFIIHTANGDVQVLGTSFNVSAYETDAEVITAVATGKVAYTPPGKTEPVMLLPGNKARYVINTRSTTVEQVTEEAEWAWTKGKIVFQADSLGRIATVLHRYFGKPVTFKNNRYRSFRYTGTFSNHSPEEILEMLDKTKRFPFSVTNQSIIIGN